MITDNVLDPVDAAALVDAAVPGTGLGVFIRLALIAGARRGELLELRWPDLDYDDELGCGTLAVACRDGGKTAHARRRVALDLRTMAMVDGWRGDQMPEEDDYQGYVFSSGQAGAPAWSPARVSRQVADLTKQAGISANAMTLRRYSMVRLQALGVAPEVIGRRLGLAMGTPGTLRFWSAEALLKADSEAAFLLAGELDEGRCRA